MHKGLAHTEGSVIGNNDGDINIDDAVDVRLLLKTIVENQSSDKRLWTIWLIVKRGKY